MLELSVVNGDVHMHATGQTTNACLMKEVVTYVFTNAATV